MRQVIQFLARFSLILEMLFVCLTLSAFGFAIGFDWDVRLFIRYGCGLTIIFGGSTVFFGVLSLILPKP